MDIYDRLNQEYKTVDKIYIRKSIDYRIYFTKTNLISLCTGKTENLFL